MKNSLIGISLITSGLLLVPLLARWDWTRSDFVSMGLLIFTTGTLIEFARHSVRNKTSRLLLIIGVLGAFFWLWVELAVGLFTNWGS